MGSRAKAAGDGGGKRRRSPLYWVFVAAYLAAAITLFYANPQILQSLRNIVFDGYQRLAPAPAPADPPVVIVDIDEESLARLGQWPWPRTAMAQLTDALGERGARAIVFDIMFAEPDRTSPEQMLTWLPPNQADSIRNVVSRWSTHDGAFAEAIARNPTVLAATLHNDVSAGGTFPLKAGVVAAGDDPAPFLPTFRGFSANLETLSEAAHGVGSINWLPDRDQVVRRVPLLLNLDGSVVPSLALEALRVADGQSTHMVRSSNAHGAAAFGQHAGVNMIRVGEHVIPTDARGSIWVHFRHSDARSHISAWRVLSGDVSEDEVNNKIVLIGTSAPGLMDLRATPLDSAIPGVEIHQQALEQIVAGRFLTRPDLAPSIELLIAIAAVLVLAFAAPRLSAELGALLGGVVVIAVFGLGAFAFLYGGYLFDPVFPSGVAFLFGAGAAVYLYSETEQQRAEIRRMFSQYIAPSVVRQLTANPERLTLGGEVRDLTLLFCDVRDFTRISEGMTAEQLTTFINRLLTPLSDVIIEQGGTIDKYMGDAIMAFWNAPMDDPEHARHACETALLMAAKMADLNAEWKAEADAAGRPYKNVAIGIGVNSGECCVGNLGSYRRFDYSAIGDNVNITSRLEGLTKLYGLAIVVGEDTARRLPDLPFLEIDLIRVKGRTTPSRLFTLLPAIAGATDNWSVVKDLQARFLSAYRAGQWSDARSLLRQLQDQTPEGLSGLYAAYETRLERLAQSPPENWDGVYDAEEK